MLAASRGTRFLLHDQRAFDPRLEAAEFVGLDALAQADQFAQRHVERLLGTLGAGAGVAEHAARVAQRMARRVNAVAQSAALADFGEQPGAHAAAEDADGAPRLEVLVVAIGHARVGDADVRLLRVVVEMLPGELSGSLRRRRRRRPAANRPAIPRSVSFSSRPVEAAGDAQDGSPGVVSLSGRTRGPRRCRFGGSPRVAPW